jgi:hypothetical protein
MSSGTSRFVQGACRAVIDLVSLMTLFPVLAVSYTGYRISVIVMIYFLKDISVDQLGAVVDQVKVIVAQIREEGWDGIELRLYRAINAVGHAAAKIANFIYAWVGGKVLGLMAGLWPEAPSQPKMLTA